MKKFISLTLAMVMLVSVILPMNAFAITWSTDIRSNIDFSTFTEKNQDGTSDWNTATEKAKATPHYAFYKVGTNGGADVEPVKGMFGKAADDTSVKLSKFSNNVNAAIFTSTVRPASGGLEPGESVVINYNMAFGDKNADRYTYATFYYDQTASYKTAMNYGSIEMSSFPTSDTDIEPLIIRANGEVVFFGKTVSKSLNYDINKWYNFEIRIINGDTEAQRYCSAELYIDGIKFDETSIKTYNNKYQMNGIYLFYFFVNGDNHAETVYLDDFQHGYFRTDAANDMYTEMHQSFELTSKSDAFVSSDGVHLDFKKDMTVEEFLADVSYNGRIQSEKTGITEVVVLKEDGTQANPTDLIENNWYARVKAEGDWNSGLSRNVYRYYTRKIHVTKMFEISDFNLDVSGNTVYAEATLTNNTVDNYNAGIILAVYNADGGLEAIKRVNLSLGVGANVLTDEVSITFPPEFNSADKVKLFVTPADDYIIIQEATIE